MAYFGVFAGFTIGGIVLWVWYRLHKDISQNGNPGPAPRKARSRVNLLICNPAISIVAAIDVIGPEGRAPDAPKSDYLRSLGIRYLRLSASSRPRPEDIQVLLYRM